MEWKNEWIENRRAQGLLEAYQKARKEDHLRVLNLQLRRWFSADADLLAKTLVKLSCDQLKEFGEAIPAFKALAGAQSWLALRV
jgi:hypothetical protein